MTPRQLPAPGRGVATLMDLMTVAVPEGRYDRIKVERFTVGAPDPNVKLNFVGDTLAEMLYEAEGRMTSPGTYTGLFELINGRGHEGAPAWIVWMSDVDAERADHAYPLAVGRLIGARRMLVNGLGLGMVIKAALEYLPRLERIDVVEIDERVIHLVGPSYTVDPRVVIYHADALKQMRAWPPGTRWDIAWHDIWREADPKYRDELVALQRSYARRVMWQGAWGHAAIMQRPKRKAAAT